MQPEFRPRLTVQHSGTTASLRGVCPIAREVCWASGSNGTILRTTDGGRTWSSIQAPGLSALDFRAIHARTRDEAILVNADEPAFVFQTRDGGTRWVQRYFNDAPGIFLDGLAFWDERRGILFGDPIDGRMVVLHTDDGGEQWHALPPDAAPRAAPGEAAFAASGTSIAAWEMNAVWIGTGGSAARVFRSIDAGRTWSAADSTLRHGAASQGVFSLAFWNEREGVAVGGDYRDPQNTQAVAALTHDGGRTWSPVEVAGPRGYRSCVSIVPGLAGPTLIAVGEAGADVSRDGGETWTPVDLTGCHAVRFVESGRAGWAVGAGGKIVRIDY